MRVAILESIIMPAGHEVEFDRILVNEMKRQGHEPMFFVPKGFPFKVDYGVPVHELLGGPVVTYADANWYQKLWRSLQREKRRVKWFTHACELAKSGVCDAIIIPTATYRYVRSLLRSELKNSPVPVHIVFHGMRPDEKENFVKQARRVEQYGNIHLHIISLRDDISDVGLQNVDVIVPPVFAPVYYDVDYVTRKPGPIRIGFFGQFRKEKQLEPFLQAFTKAQFSVPVELVVQGSTPTPEDTAVFQELIAKYQRIPNITFRHENLIGKDWEEALLSVDAIAMPYAAERYRYNWGAMLFTAIGFYKPVLASQELNPEVFERFKVGVRIQSLGESDIISAMMELVELLSVRKEETRLELVKANTFYSHEKLIKAIIY
ncbi:glycosyltransferase [Veillonella sp. CHU740]|uniref:glycosyltransferase n=1 Tax=Veillonella sp. CHU740 TaxID=2490950 RepID=UPI000F8ECC44|nr:glycosyltransferase [Veillonella sp. CHU740]